jgi:hypothetical protein
MWCSGLGFRARWPFPERWKEDGSWKTNPTRLETLLTDFEVADRRTVQYCTYSRYSTYRELRVYGVLRTKVLQTIPPLQRNMSMCGSNGQVKSTVRHSACTEYCKYTLPARRRYITYSPSRMQSEGMATEYLRTYFATRLPERRTVAPK